MTPARRAVAPPVLLAAVAALASLAGCGGGGGNRTAVATGPSQSAQPVTTAPTTPTAKASPTPVPTAAPTPTPEASPTPAPTGGGIIPSGDPNGAVEVGQYLYPSSTGIACGARTGHYDACPVSGRLASRLDSHPIPHAEPLCRCQNLWQKAAVSTTQTPDPAIWIDHVVLTFGPAYTITMDLRVLRTDGGWVGDDTTCTGQGESTSIYVQNPPACSGA